METGKTGKYLKYAIGEIVLVVIGILIALQINNWNENKKSTRMAESYIEDIRQDLISDTIMFNTALKRANQTIIKNKAILKINYPNTISSDSLYSILTVFHSMRIYHINNATYSKLLNTGFLESNFYKALFSNINTYYTKEYATYSEYIEWDEEQAIDIMHNDFLGDYKKNLDVTSLLPEHNEHFNQEALNTSVDVIRQFIVSTQFRNKVLSNYTRKMSVAERLLIQKQLASELLRQINKELPSND